MDSPRKIIKSFLPGTQHLAEPIIERLRDAGYMIVPIDPPPEAIEAGNWVHERDGVICYRNMVRAADAGLR